MQPESSKAAMARARSSSVEEGDSSDEELLSATDDSTPSKPAGKIRQTKKGPPKVKVGRRKQDRKGKGREALDEGSELEEMDNGGENHGDTQ